MCNGSNPPPDQPQLLRLRVKPHLPPAARPAPPPSPATRELSSVAFCLPTYYPNCCSSTPSLRCPGYPSPFSHTHHSSTDPSRLASHYQTTTRSREPRAQSLMAQQQTSPDEVPSDRSWSRPQTPRLFLSSAFRSSWFDQLGLGKAVYLPMAPRVLLDAGGARAGGDRRREGGHPEPPAAAQRHLRQGGTAPLPVCLPGSFFFFRWKLCKFAVRLRARCFSLQVYLLAQFLEKWEKDDDAKLVIFKVHTVYQCVDELLAQHIWFFSLPHMWSNK